MGEGQREARQAGARAQVGPMFTWMGAADRYQPEGVVEVPRPQSSLFSRSEEAQPDRLGIGLLQRLAFLGGESRTPARGLLAGLMFHVKR